MIERIYKDNDRYYWIDDDEIDKLRKSGTSAEGNIRCQCPVCGDHSKNWSMSYNIRLGKGRCFHTAHHIFINIRMKHGLQHVASPEGAPLKFVDVDKLKLTPIVDEFLKYMLDNRGISYGTAVALGWKQCYRTRNGCTSAWLATPYYNAGKIVNVQYRNMKDKAFEFEKGAVPGLQNVDAVLGTEEMFIVEGSMDLATLFEAGHQNTVSLGNGADTNMENFDYFRKTHFDDKRKIFIAGDMDGPGMKARERQLKYFGYGKCHMVYWQYEDEEKGISISANDANGLWMSAKEKGLDPKGGHRLVHRERKAVRHSAAQPTVRKQRLRARHPAQRTRDGKDHRPDFLR
jgi:5S rRNA maturation endonuclease (ribonuclease M5)